MKMENCSRQTTHVKFGGKEKSGKKLEGEGKFKERILEGRKKGVSREGETEDTRRCR